MADTFAGSGNVKVTSAGTPTTYNLGQTVNLSGYRITQTLNNLATGTWISLTTGSLTNISQMVFNNPSGSQGPIVVATSSSLSNRITTISPGSVPAVIPWSGTTALFCSASVVSSSIQYDLMY